MGGIRRSAATTLLAVALLATACSGDGGPEGVDAGTSESGSAIDAALGNQAVQDFAIHLDMWTLDAEGDRVDLSAPILAAITGGAGAPEQLVGGYELASVTGLAARLIDADGKALPSLSVDFGLLRAPMAATVPIRQAVTSELPDGVRLDEAALSSPMLVEIVTADYERTRVHSGPGDRTAIDVTFLEDLAPADPVGLHYLFGQTLPGDPAEELGLSPLALFAHRWNRGLIRVRGGEGGPTPMRADDIVVREGSTVLTREVKAGLTLAAGVVAAGAPDGLYKSSLEFLDQPAGFGDLVVVQANVEVPLPGTGSVSADVVVTGVRPEGGGEVEVSSAALRIPFTEPLEFHGPDSLDKAKRALALIRFLVACSSVGAALQAQNESGRDTTSERLAAAIARFPTLRTEDGDPEPEPEVEISPAPATAPQPPPYFDCVEPEDPGPGFGASAFGDVRITTLDGVAYGQQAPGEFLLFENATTTLQMRAAPAGASNNLTIATAFAVGTGGEAIAMHDGGRLFVNGELRELERGERVRVGDAEVLQGIFDWTVAWPDGQVVTVFDRGDANGMMLTVQPVERFAIGQFGNGDGDPTNDFASRGGTQFDESIVDDHELFYGSYVDSWRLTPDESLFHYDDGETTESFAIEGFPSTGFGVGDLGQAAFEEAAAICEAASVVDEFLFDGCVVDVAATGDPGYAYDTFRVQLATTPRVDPAEAEPVDVPAGTPGDTLLTIAGDTLVFGDDPPGQRPQGIAPSWDCQIIDGDLFADGSIDLADGPRYSILVQYRPAEPRLTLLLETPNADGLTRNYAWVETSAPHFADAVDAMVIEGQRFTATGQVYVNESLELLGIGAALPPDATLVPFTLDLDCT